MANLRRNFDQVIIHATSGGGTGALVAQVEQSVADALVLDRTAVDYLANLKALW